MSVSPSMGQVPPSLGAFVRAKVFLLDTGSRDVELRLHGGCERDKAKAKPTLRLHLGKSEHIVVGVFHHILLSRCF